MLLNLLPTVLELFGYTCVIKNHFPCCTHESGESKKPDPNPAKTWELIWFCLFYNLFWILSVGGNQFKRKYLVGLKPTLEVVEFSIQNPIHFFCCCCWLFFFFLPFVWRWMESYGLSLPSVLKPWLLVGSWSILVANNISLYYGCWELI